MLIKFFNRVLDTLGRVYSFEGRQSTTDKMDLGAVSLVHDVSRISGLNSVPSRAKGWAQIVLSNNHVASGGIQTIFGLFSQLTQQTAIELDLTRDWVWIMRTQLEAEIVAGNSITEAVVGYANVPPFGVTTQPLVLELAFNFTGLSLTVGGPGYAMNTADDELPTTFAWAGPCFPGSTVNLSSVAVVAAGDIDLNANLLCFACPQGVYPPGFG